MHKQFVAFSVKKASKMRTYASYHEIGTKFFFSTPTIISPNSDAFELQISIVILQYRCKSPLAMAVYLIINFEANLCIEALS